MEKRAAARSGDRSSFSAKTELAIRAKRRRGNLHARYRVEGSPPSPPPPRRARAPCSDSNQGLRRGKVGAGAVLDGHSSAGGERKTILVVMTDGVGTREVTLRRTGLSVPTTRNDPAPSACRQGRSGELLPSGVTRASALPSPSILGPQGSSVSPDPWSLGNAFSAVVAGMGTAVRKALAGLWESSTSPKARRRRAGRDGKAEADLERRPRGPPGAHGSVPHRGFHGIGRFRAQVYGPKT